MSQRVVSWYLPAFPCCAYTALPHSVLPPRVVIAADTIAGLIPRYVEDSRNRLNSLAAAAGAQKPEEEDPQRTSKLLFEAWEHHLTARGSQGGGGNSTEAGGAAPFRSAKTTAAQRAVGKYTERRTAGFFLQVWMFFARALQQKARHPITVALDLSLVFVAGLVLGVLFSEPLLKKVTTANLLTTICVGMTTGASSVRVFGGELTQFRREAASGISRVAYFLGKNIAELPMLILTPVMFLSMFTTLTTPRTNLGALYAIVFMGTWAVSGMAYMISVIVDPRDAQLATVVLVLISSMFGGVNPTLAKLQTMGFVSVGAAALSYGRYMNEAMLSANVARWPEVWCTEINSQLLVLGFDLGAYSFCLLSLLLLGVGFRIVACWVLVFDGRSAVQELRTAVAKLLRVSCLCRRDPDAKVWEPTELVEVTINQQRPNQDEQGLTMSSLVVTEPPREEIGSSARPNQDELGLTLSSLTDSSAAIEL